MLSKQGKSWWAVASAVTLVSVESVSAFFLPAAAGVRPFVAGLDASSRHHATAGPAGHKRSSPGAWRMGLMGADFEGNKDLGALSERDQAMGFLTAEALDTVETRQARARFLAQEAQDAHDAAKEAAELAKRVKAQLGTSRSVKAPQAKSNGLSGMLSPVALKMATQQGEYIRRCPIRQMQEDLLEIRCGVMNIVGALGPQNLLALGAVLYVISVIQISN